MNISQQQLTVGIWEVEVHGRLDQTQTPDLNTTLTELINAQQYRLLVNLTETNYINSGGLRCLVSAWRKARAHEGDVILYGLNERLCEIFTMIGFDKVFEIYQTQEEALSAMPPFN
ncbi:MAG: STAS domain-containing protein [Chloroflexi bacterium]|jgi:anti-sigma B factor antagonist|nr:STAS domain-containing protein [Chloroflexota bacterium]MBK6712557.1 STAS domain-containing protein [Chloroflexota bacterium]MBK7178252.1 STAS domain-containing protein [Chloroflexota bacterium]MBK7916360.1 STAS domain-containing protein [Chloroflexota bacterium]MBK8933740.1 STAS domain-containing protein [Chloroflexota bacterium]